MAKKLIAVTNIKGGEGDGAGFIEAGAEVDTKKFSKDQLRQLLDSGAVEIQDDAPPAKPKDESDLTEDELNSEVSPSTTEDPDENDN